MVKECQQSYTIVTSGSDQVYYEYTRWRSPQYDDVFICFRVCHITQAYFTGSVINSAVRRTICTDWGRRQALGFFTSRRHTICKRFHPTLAKAMLILHFRGFITHTGPLYYEINENFSLKIIHIWHNQRAPKHALIY